MSAPLTSVLRYPGGKSKALKFILPHILKNNFSEFREPFVGGGSVFIAVKQKVTPDVKFRINDLNPDIYCFWNVLKRNGYLFADEITRIKNEERDGKALFHRLRAQDPRELSEFDRAVRFFLLNRISFSGGIDTSGYSQEAFEKRLTTTIIEKLPLLSDLVYNIEVSNLDYSDLLFEDGESTFVFLDPPYYKTTKNRLYGKNGLFHTTFDHEKLAETMKFCSQNYSYHWLITYDDTPEIRELYDFAFMKEWKLTYGVNNIRGVSTSKIGDELFISNFPLTTPIQTPLSQTTFD